MTDDSGIRAAFVEAYPRYVARLLHDRGIDVDSTIADGIIIGTEVLDGLLTTLESRPPELQRHSPLELFREALRPVGNALATAGVDPAVVDRNQAELLPWDVYSLSPGSAQQISPEAHEAHLRWGVAKAQAHAIRPVAALRCSETDAPALLDQLNGLGYRVVRAPADSDVTVGIVDIAEGGVDRIVSAMASRGTSVIVFAEDPDDLQTMRFKALGATEVLTTRELIANLADHLPLIA